MVICNRISYSFTQTPKHTKIEGIRLGNPPPSINISLASHAWSGGDGSGADLGVSPQ